jgi:formylglycine-generating enzyme required for sulfatase activity
VGLGKEPGKTPHEKHKGIKGVYPWGKEWPPTKGAGNYRSSLSVDDFDWTSPVGSFSANKYGIHDLGGNVWEWCEDKSLGWDRSGAAHILRGASFTIPDQTRLLSSYRYGSAGSAGSAGSGSGAGFRCVLAVD